MLNLCVTVKFGRISRWQIFMQIRPKNIEMLHYANLLSILYTSHIFLPLTIAQLSTLKQVRFFWPTLYSTYAVWYKICI